MSDLTPERIEAVRQRLREAVRVAAMPTIVGRYSCEEAHGGGSVHAGCGGGTVTIGNIDAALDRLVRFERAEAVAASWERELPCTTPSHANPPSGVTCSTRKARAELEAIIAEVEER